MSTPPSLPKLFGAYQLFDSISDGNTATIYFGRRQETNFAIKHLKPQWQSNGQVANRFLKNAETLSKIKHSRLLNVVDYGIIGNSYFSAMELVACEPLEAINRPSLRLALYLIRQACELLHF